jgi:N-acyl-L-homoserine lactone synthetase
MQSARHVAPVMKSTRHTSIFKGLLRGYRFSVCETPAAAARALEVRQAVYVEDCGYDIPIPDEYDSRSWFLVAEHLRTGEVVGSMRVTPRAAGCLEAEEYFRLPPSLTSPRVVEVTRFAILPPYRKSKRFLPVVAMGLFKLVCNFVKLVDAQYVVVCSKPERVWTYQWLKFERTGLLAEYVKLGNASHELLSCNLNGGIARHRDHRYWEFFFDIDHPEVRIPEKAPELGLVRDVQRTLVRRMA